MSELSERDRAKVKIAKLLNRTTGNGCTEAEALNAAEKAGQMMAVYDIQASELSIKSTRAIKIEVPLAKYNSKQLGEQYVVSLARFCDCKVWRGYDRHGDRRRRTYCFFGMPQDVEIAAYLYDLLTNATIAEFNVFNNGPQLGLLVAKGFSPRMSRFDFIAGVETRLRKRILELDVIKRQTVSAATGTSLVVVKEAQIEEDFKVIGVKLTKSYSESRGIHAGDAWRAGQDAGDRINITQGVGERKQEKLS